MVFGSNVSNVFLLQRLYKALPAVEKLVLRNVQSIKAYHSYPYIPQVYIKDFICAGNVRYLDLSYNDIAFINLSEMCWNSKLEELILDHNLMAQPYNGEQNWYFLPFLKLARRLKVLSINYCSGSWHHNDLWNDKLDKANAMELEDESADPVTSFFEASPSMSALTTFPLNFIATYGSWFKDMLKHCAKLDTSYSKLQQCFTSNNTENVCMIFNCLASSSDINDDICNEGDTALSILNGKYTQQVCDSSCAFGIGLPVPRSLTKISFHHSGQYMQMYVPHQLRGQEYTVFCLDPSNNIETVDLTQTVFNDIESGFQLFEFRGLNKLKFFSIQGCQIPFVINPRLFADMDSLEEVHIGGNNLSANDVLPSVLFQTNIKLSIVNLSNANLRGIESDAFVNNKHLTVLDLSHNYLSSSSLAALDLSQNNIKILKSLV